MIEYMKRLTIAIYSILIATIIIPSCDPGLGYEYFINNQSDSLLSVHFRVYGIQRDSVTIVDPKTQYLIFETSVIGSHPKDEGEYFLNMFDTMAVLLESGKSIKTDINQRKSWKYTNEIRYFGLIKTGTNIYTLDLTNDNLK